MSGAHRLHGRRRRSGWVVPAGFAVAVAAALSAPGVALALFVSTPSAQTASVTAATIGAPTNFSAIATGSTAAKLSWTAPSTLTGYTLSQSPGTLAGCSATPSASTTSCTATGLSPGTSYTWTLTAVYNNWNSSSVQARATTFQVVGATALGKATNATSGSSSATVSGVSTTSGAALLILVYRQASSGSVAFSASNPITGTAVTSGSSSAVTSQGFNSGGNHYAVLAAEATGNGTSGTVVVNFSSANNVTTTVDVIQLSGDNTTNPIAGFAVSTGNVSTVTGGTLSPGASSDGELFFVGLSAAETMTTPASYTALDAPVNPATATHGGWSSTSASGSGVTTTLGASATWGTIEIEISHG